MALLLAALKCSSCSRRSTPFGGPVGRGQNTPKPAASQGRLIRPAAFGQQQLLAVQVDHIPSCPRSSGSRNVALLNFLGFVVEDSESWRTLTSSYGLPPSISVPRRRVYVNLLANVHSRALRLGPTVLQAALLLAKPGRSRRVLCAPSMRFSSPARPPARRGPWAVARPNDPCSTEPKVGHTGDLRRCDYLNFAPLTDRACPCR